MIGKERTVCLAHDTGVRGQADEITQVQYYCRVKRRSAITLPEIEHVICSCF